MTGEEHTSSLGPLVARRRWRLKLGVRVAMALIVLACVPLAAWNQHARNQRRALAVVRRLGAEVYFNTDSAREKTVPGRRLSAPTWLREFVGEAFFRDIVEIRLTGNERDDEPHIHGEELAILADLPHLKTLELSCYVVEDSDLKPLRRMTRLQNLDLQSHYHHVTDKGISYLSGLCELRELNISSNHVTDVGIANLKTLNSLEVLDISDTGITDAGLRTLTGLMRVRSLRVSPNESIGGRTITDEGVASLSQLSNLEALYVDNVRLSKTSLSELRKLTRLRTLELWNLSIDESNFSRWEGWKGLEKLTLACALTDAGLAHLARIPSLKVLDIRGCGRVTSSGRDVVGDLCVSTEVIHELQRARPKLQVMYDSDNIQE
jgi:hypothetical protein